MRDRKERFRLRGEHGLLFAQVLDADGQDRPVRRGLFAEPPQIRLAERPFPRKRLTRNRPGPAAVPLTFGGLGQLGRQRGHVVESRHVCTVLVQSGRSWSPRSSNNGHWLRFGHSQRAAHSSQPRTSSLRSISATISGSFRLATSRSRSIATESSGDTESSTLISSRARPARCPVSITASVRTTPASYLRRPFTRTGSGNSPICS